MMTPEKLRLVAEIISEMANIPPGVRDPLAEAADAWEADIARREALERAAIWAQQYFWRIGEKAAAAMMSAALREEAQHE